MPRPEDLIAMRGVTMSTMSVEPFAPPGGTRYRRDGNYYLLDYCDRCKGMFYTHALANAETGTTRTCPWCKGQCSASEQDRRNEEIEGRMR